MQSLGKCRFLRVVMGICGVGAMAPGLAQQPVQNRATPPAALLAAMANTDTAGHPDQAGEFAGAQAYAHGDYALAMKQFLRGAYYADKLSQLSIGLMYANGEGVSKDPVRAFAWVAIAAERKYPQFLATRDALWRALDNGQREQARAEVARLYAQYGDAVAKPRMVRQLRQGLSQMTGSYLGGTSSHLLSFSPDYRANCGVTTLAGAPAKDCGGRWEQAWRWQPDAYFQSRDGEWQGNTVVGPLQMVGNAPPPPASKPQ